MAGYKTRSSWSAPDIQFDKDGRRIRPEPTLLHDLELANEPCRSRSTFCVLLRPVCTHKCEYTP